MTVKDSAKIVIDYFNRPDIKWVNRMPNREEYLVTDREECLVTAMDHALLHCDGGWFIFDELSNAIRQKIGTFALGTWNDEEGRTRDDVMNLLQSIVDDPEN
jgi:hypothetical protein